MRKVFACAALACGVLTMRPAMAADLLISEPPISQPPIIEDIPGYIWSGFYVGASAGIAGADITVGDTYDYNGDPYKETDMSSTGGIANIQLGYNVQRGNIVYGLEAELGFLGISDEETAFLPHAKNEEVNELYGTYKVDGGFYGDLALRLGYAADNLLIYVKGGPAFMNVDLSADFIGNNFRAKDDKGRNWRESRHASKFSFSDSDTLWGWTAGAGVEYAVDSRLSIKAEYQHFDFETSTLDHNGSYSFKPGYESVLKGTSDFDPSVDVVKIGVNYKLD